MVDTHEEKIDLEKFKQKNRIELEKLKDKLAEKEHERKVDRITRIYNLVYAQTNDLSIGDI